jgi:hypothetical protein
MGIVHVVARLVRKADGTRGFILEGNQSIFAKNHLRSAQRVRTRRIISVIHKLENRGK